MALNTSKCNHLTPLHFKGLRDATCLCRQNSFLVLRDKSVSMKFNVRLDDKNNSVNDKRHYWAHIASLLITYTNIRTKHLLELLERIMQCGASQKSSVISLKTH